MHIFSNTNTSSYCSICGKELSGRLGKKFCSDQCRARFNNRKKQLAEASILQINNTLRTNRRVLQKFFETGNIITNEVALEQQGFDFRFFTHQVTLDRVIYYCCYEWGYARDYFKKVKIITYTDFDTLQPPNYSTMQVE